MSQATVAFLRCIQDSQEYGSDNEHMVSRVFFTLQIDDSDPLPLYANVKQIVGSDYDTAPLEVSWPKDYEGPLSYHAYRDAVEGYYRNNVGPQALGIGKGSKNIRMYGNVFEIREVVQFDVESGGAPW